MEELKDHQQLQKLQAAISLIPDANDTGFGSFLDSILSTPLKRLSSDV